MLNKLSLSDIDVKNKRVLVRVDFNVPLDQGRITDDTRIKATLPTILHLIEHGAKVILMTHLGRPKGADQTLSTAPLAGHLSGLIGQRVKHVPDCIGSEVEKRVKELENGNLLLLENIRFHAEEKSNEPEFAKKLASIGDIYLNDAFGTAHRAHASTEGVTHHFDLSAAGFLLEREIKFLSKVMTSPELPLVAIIGGAKVSDKITVIEALLDRVSTLLIGGGMAYTFFKAMGREIGKSIVENDKLEMARELMEKVKDRDVKLMLPIDNVVAQEFSADAESMVVGSNEIPRNWEGLDIGPETVEKFGEIIRSAKTIFWNGPLGVYEFDRFAQGTIGIAKQIAEASATSIVGGGDCVAAVHKAGVADRITHISTGGGASLELLEGKDLPGIVALTDKKS